MEMRCEGGGTDNSFFMACVRVFVEHMRDLSSCAGKFVVQSVLMEINDGCGALLPSQWLVRAIMEHIPTVEDYIILVETTKIQSTQANEAQDFCRW